MDAGARPTFGIDPATTARGVRSHSHRQFRAPISGQIRTLLHLSTGPVIIHVMAFDVVPYREEWPAQFAVVAEELRRALVAVPSVSVEHVGSTSVPGLAAKPILDIDVVVASRDVRTAIAALQALGYVHRGIWESRDVKRSDPRMGNPDATSTFARREP
jgi:GrpB-like predicted nucleotidyltransferase (UPF0157 family)